LFKYLNAIQYDFIFKHRLTGGSLSIAEKSYWAVQQKEARTALDTEIAAAAAAAAKIEKIVTAEDMARVAEYEEMCTDLNSKKNAAFRKARVALDGWLLLNPGIEAKHTKVIAIRAAHKTVRQLIKDGADWDAAPLLSLGPQETCLRKWGFLPPAAAAAAAAAPPCQSLTTLGLLASEVNEGHNILMPLLATSGRCDALTGGEIACILAGFLKESGGDRENPPSIEDVGLRAEALDILYWIDDTARACRTDEDRAGIFSSWELTPLWVCVAARWLAGATLTEIAADYGLFEGNVQRSLLRIANLLEEWASLATLRRDLPTLEKLGALRFLRDEIIVDSLYLHL